MGKRVTANHVVGFAIHYEVLLEVDILLSDKILGVGLAGLVEWKFAGQFLPLKGYREGVSTWVWDADLSHLESVIGKEIVQNVIILVYCVKF